MKQILIIHDGKSLSIDKKATLDTYIQDADIVNIVYVIPQNLIHYGQVDTLASSISKDDFIKYVQEQGILECKERLGPFVTEIEKSGYGFEVKLHVRWGNMAEALEDVTYQSKLAGIYVPQNTFGIDWNVQKNKLSAKLAEILHIL